MSNPILTYRGKKLCENSNNFTIDEKVVVVPEWTNRDKPRPKMRIMYVKEFDVESNTIGLSHHKEHSEHVYGILKEIVWKFNN